MPASVDRRFDGVQDLGQVRQEIRFVQQHQRAGVTAAAAGRESLGPAAIAQHKVVGRLLEHALGLQPFRQPGVHLDEAVGEQLDGLVVALAHEHDVGRRVEQHQPERVGQRQPRHPQLPGFEHDGVRVHHEVAQHLALRRPGGAQIQRWRIAGGVGGRSLVGWCASGDDGTQGERSSSRPWNMKASSAAQDSKYR